MCHLCPIILSRIGLILINLERTFVHSPILQALPDKNIVYLTYILGWP